MSRRHFHERHYVGRTGWLRAAVLGANDGIVSVASLLVGVAATTVPRQQAVLVGIAGLVAGAMSMSAGEFVSVSSQADSERSDLERERLELATDSKAEHAELAGIYVKRGLQPALAHEVAAQLMAHDALGAHARDELGIAAGARAMPLLAIIVAPSTLAVPLIAASSLLFLGVLGAVSARIGGAPIAAAVWRVTFW